MSFNAGTQVGQYRIIEQLGQGGMAIVYKAYHASLDRYVAIKVLHRAFMEDAGFQARFQREARVVARLEHPNIVPIYDYAEHEGQPYLVMKYIEGDTLKARLQRGPLTASEVTHVMESVGAALTYAHKQGILHRDIKPSNVINANDGQIYLADFGLARIAQSGESTLTSDMVLGTPQYMSPEQAMAKKDLDDGTDIYSFGVMLYEMTVGRVPFSSDTPFSVIHDHIYTPLPLPGLVNPGISPALERVLLKALSKERADRFDNIASMLAAFKEAWASSSSTLAASAEAAAPETGTGSRVTASSPLTLPVQPEPVPADAPSTPVADSKKTDSKRPLWLAAGLIPLLCICCVGGFLYIGAQNERTSGPSNVAKIELTLDAAFEDATATTAPATNSPDTPQLTMDEAKKLAEQNPRDPKAHLFYGFTLVRDGQGATGYDEIKKGIKLAGRNQAVLLAAAKSFEEQESWLAAALVYVSLTDNARVMPPARVEAMHKAVYLGFEQSIAPEVLDYGTIGKVDQPLSLLAQVRYNLNAGDDIDLAESLLNQLKSSSTNPDEIKLLQSELFIDNDDNNEAQKLLQDLIDAPNTAPWIKVEAEILISSIE